MGWVLGVTSSCGLVNLQRNGGSVGVDRSKYHVDLWRCVRRRWMVAGVLAALALAVLAPHAGAQLGKQQHCMLLLDHS